jgi:glycosyltransferase involved in cell wall biosynthesis
MRTFIAYPPLSAPTGGTAVLLRIAGHLAEAGHEVRLVPRESRAGAPDPFASGPSGIDVPVLPWDEASPGRDDIWLAPEGWPALLGPGLRRQARTVIYVQNWAYLLASVPAGTAMARLPVSLIAVSAPVAWHIGLCTGMPCEILRPGLDLSRLHPEAGGAGVAPERAVRVAWMPRKNKALAQRIQEMFQSRCLHGADPGPVEWVSIHRRDPDEVARLLRSCPIFLATGFPEGCPLPPLEAMASGCLVVGFSGFGGWDYMRQAWPRCGQPWTPMEQPPARDWGGNGFFVPDADVIAATLALEDAVRLCRRGGPELAAILHAAAATASAYGLDRQALAVRELWARASDGRALPPGVYLQK